ncbi:cytosolic carboxypeptidase 2 isoform X3 [Perca fluviatilis]|uniref:cytosolic carboxypeptidase 2 isoform X3 n=1 Tax=Perca fluviatilis TaxID=8168 RepID=UPI0019625466|nr:cytosolic carboxypeptidase 2 isoform X3 [Perca fluviatilis]XP_039664516.1 cytosolic carboxypeptidase 2 isoform X3 [Perca fluviatilis]XP_039664518.1 cytosolic carboxypeptidase 2 isoform X3 [Perca fluviatilis]
MAVSAIRNWWNTHQLDKSDTNDSNTEEDEEELAGRRQLSINLSQTLRTRQLLIDFDGGRPTLSLRAPLDLVNFPSIFRPRWPIECEVNSDIIHHIEWDPPEPEPFYQPTGHERTPMPAGEEREKVVYCIDHATKRPYFTCSRVGGSRGPIKSATSYDGRTDFTLEFESRFESGNLQKAVQVGVYDYEITLRTDMYTRKHTQWFYFRVRNMKAGVTYRFTIVNLMKSSSLYSQGMRPLLYSERAANDKGIGWQRTGSNIRYYRNSNQNTKDNNSDTVTLYSLTWTLQFPYDSDTCYLAHCYPYTYSHLQRYLRRISSNPAVASYCTLRVLCHSLAGNAVYVVTITSRGGGRVAGRKKKAVVVTARVHPGETNGSWMMEGFLDFLLGDSEDAQLLRDTFVFKVVPMLNPDGVVVGNYRCSLAGRDLNRYYKTLLRDSFPCVWHTRNMVERLMAETDVVLYCDFHGHNRKNNVFMYGCNNRGDASLKLHERVFPLMMSKNASNKFSFKSCKFRVQKGKEGTGRIAMWRLGIKNSYTMEATFGGSTLGDRRGTHFTTRDLKSLGFYFCDTLLDYCDPDPTKTTYCLTELAALLTKEVRERLGKDLGTDCNFSVSDLETSTSGSNSSDSDGLPVHLLNQPQTAHPEQTVKKKKKRLRSCKERDTLRPERVKNNTQPKVLQSSVKNIESNLPHEDTVKGIIQEKTVGRHRKKWQAKGLLRNAEIPPPTTHPREVSQVTLWQGCEPVKDRNMKGACPHHRVEACPHLGTYTDDLGMYTGQWRCSSQLLHLSALLPPSPNPIIHSSQQQQRCPQQSFVSYKVYRGLPSSLTALRRSPSSVYIKMIPDLFPRKRLLSSFTTDKVDARHILRNSLLASERDSVPEDSSPSHADMTETKRLNEEQEEDSSEVGLSLLKCIPLGEQNQRDLTPDVPRRGTEPRNYFLPVQKGTDLRRNGLGNETLEDKRHLGVLSSLSKPSGLMKMERPRPKSGTLGTLQAKDIRHYYSGRESQISAAMVARSSQSAPL